MTLKDIKKMNTDELEMEYSFLWKILDNLSIKDWDKLNERMHCIAYELTLREIPIMTYHYLVDDILHKSDMHRINWRERRFISLKESIYSYDRPQSYDISLEEFINRCNNNYYADNRWSFKYLIKFNDYYIEVNSKYSYPSVDAAKKNWLRNDFKYIRAISR